MDDLLHNVTPETLGQQESHAHYDVQKCMHMKQACQRKSMPALMSARRVAGWQAAEAHVYIIEHRLWLIRLGARL